MNKKIVVLIPVYNPNEKIMEKFLDELSKNFENIVFINDGCSKKYDKFMDNIAKKYPVLKHHINYGKGRGLKNGLNYILNEYKNCKVIVTADCDGQHSVKDIKRVADVALKSQDDLVLGVRCFKDSGVPFKSKFGNIITRNVLYNFVGVKTSDTQTGLRAMSYDVARKLLDLHGERYEYETNVLIETNYRGIDIKEVVIDTIYINNNETSHFNPVKDSLKVYRLFAYYILVTLFAYIIECFIFYKTFDISNKFWVLPLFLFLSKLVSTIIIMMFNNHINIKYTIINYACEAIILSLLSRHRFIFKILIDIVMFVLCITCMNIKTYKEKVTS